tara:strand:+ start:1078 stop:1743 length:666 start_codon:yes stop_codon:yes gene_type:complete
MRDRKFQGIWIPRNVYLNRDLTWIEKILLVEIDSLDKGDKGCFASNDYFAEFLNVSKTHISKSINHLIELKFLRLHSFNGRTRILKSALNSTSKQTLTGVQSSIEQNFKSELNSTSSIIIKTNNTNTETGKPVRAKQNKPNSFNEVESYFVEKLSNKFIALDFYEYYENIGWKVGKNPMKKWKLAANRWIRNNKDKSKEKGLADTYFPDLLSFKDDQTKIS